VRGSGAGEAEQIVDRPDLNRCDVVIKDAFGEQAERTA